MTVIKRRGFATLADQAKENILGGKPIVPGPTLDDLVGKHIIPGPTPDDHVKETILVGKCVIPGDGTLADAARQSILGRPLSIDTEIVSYSMRKPIRTPDQAQAVRESLAQNSQRLNTLYETVEKRFVDAGFGVDAEVHVNNPDDEVNMGEYTMLGFRRYRGAWQFVIETGVLVNDDVKDLEVTPLSGVSRQMRLLAAPELEKLWGRLVEKAAEMNDKCVAAISQLEMVLQKTAGFDVPGKAPEDQAQADKKS